MEFANVAGTSAEAEEEKEGGRGWEFGNFGDASIAMGGENPRPRSDTAIGDALPISLSGTEQLHCAVSGTGWVGDCVNLRLQMLMPGFSGF